MKLSDLLIVAAFIASLASLIVFSFFEPLYGLAGIGLLLVGFGLVVLIIRRANRPTSARIAAMRIKR